jgi:tetratricopeptide (TPR) repeat protein
MLLLAISVATACGSQKKAANESRAGKGQETTDPRLAERVTSKFIDASKEKILGNFRQAITLYQNCLELNPLHAPSMYEMARLLRMQGSVNDALDLAERAVEIDPNNKWYNVLLASVYEQSGQIGQAIKVLGNLLELYPNELEFMHQMALLYLKETRFADAIAVYDKIERINGTDEDIIIQKQQLYILDGQPQKAIAEIEKLINLYPGESRYYALLADLHLELGNFQEAIANLEKIREFDPQNPYIPITLAEYYFRTENHRQAIAELKSGFANPGLDMDIKFQVLFTYFTDDEIHGEYQEDVAELTEILIATHPNDVRPYSVKANMLIQEEKFEEARDVFRRMLSIDNSSFFIWETMLRINAMLRDTMAMRDESIQAIEIFPLQPLPYLFAGLAYFQLEDYPEAIKMFKNGKDLVVDDDELLAEFFMHLGDTYNRAGQHEASDSAFDQALALDPENSYTLNNYSYYLSLRKERLDVAKEMSAKSLELSPDNKHYLDTYGWILYQMGNYDEAKIWIEKSIENNASEDAVVLEHFGDVLYKLGRKEEALKYWKQALELGGHEITEFLEDKVRDGRLYE